MPVWTMSQLGICRGRWERDILDLTGDDNQSNTATIINELILIWKIIPYSRNKCPFNWRRHIFNDKSLQKCVQMKTKCAKENNCYHHQSYVQLMNISVAYRIGLSRIWYRFTTKILEDILLGSDIIWKLNTKH